MAAHLPWLKGQKEPVYRLWPLSCQWPAGTPQPEVCWCGGSSAAPWVPCPLPPHVSADTLLPAELHQLAPAFTQQLWTTHWHLLLRTNERSRAAKAHLVNDWIMTVDTQQPSFWPEFGATWRTSSQFRLLPAHCLVGQLSHSVKLLLHLVCFCVTAGRSSHFTYLIDRMKSDLRADLRQTKRFSSSSSFWKHRG